MIIAKVVGTIVCDKKNTQIEGGRFLLLEKTNQKAEGKNDFIVALDLVGAGYDELVFVSESSSARETNQTNNKPIDAIIVGIIDLIDENEILVYKK